MQFKWKRTDRHIDQLCFSAVTNILIYEWRFVGHGLFKLFSNGTSIDFNTKCTMECKAHLIIILLCPRFLSYHSLINDQPVVIPFICNLQSSYRWCLWDLHMKSALKFPLSGDYGTIKPCVCRLSHGLWQLSFLFFVFLLYFCFWKIFQAQWPNFRSTTTIHIH